MRPGTVSMTHSFGGVPGKEDDVRKVGSNPGRLVADDVAFDRYSGQPRMSNIPLRVRLLRDYEPAFTSQPEAADDFAEPLGV